MIVVIAIDALEYSLVEEFENKNLQQASHGKTDITMFSQPRTMVLWSSFMTCENKEAEVLAGGDKAMWGTRWPIEETFFKDFKNPKIIDLPGFNYDKKTHDRSRMLLKKYFDAKDPNLKESIRKEYNKDAFDHHRRIKKEYTAALAEEHDFILAYFSIADVIGHLNFGNKTMMKLIYNDLDELAGKSREATDELLILSDHGMKAIGIFGDHSEHGFWSTSWKTKMEKPQITDFGQILTN